MALIFSVGLIKLFSYININQKINNQMEKILDQSLLNKIRKLVKLEESATKIGSIEEAANAAEKIRQILMKHNLEMHTLNLEDPDNKKEEPVDGKVEDISELTQRHESIWVNSLAAVIARHNLCYVLMRQGEPNSIILIGTPSNKAIVWYTLIQLVNRLRPLAKETFKSYRGTEKRNTFIRGFLAGAVVGIRQQLDANAQKEVDDSHKIGGAQSQALQMQSMMKYEKDRVQNYAQSRYNIGRSKATPLSSQNGRASGIEAGRNMSINAGIAGRSSSGNKMLN